MKKHRKWPRIMGFTFIELMAVAAIITAIPGSHYAQAKARANAAVEANELRQLGQLLQMHTMENDRWPQAAFYPKDPVNGSDSIRQILGGDARLWVSSALPQTLQDKGLTYIYNDGLGGKRTNSSKVWVLMDMTAVVAGVPPPYPGGYNILYADGHVETTKNLPPDIMKARAAQAKGRR